MRLIILMTRVNRYGGLLLKTSDRLPCQALGSWEVIVSCLQGG